MYTNGSCHCYHGEGKNNSLLRARHDLDFCVGEFAFVVLTHFLDNDKLIVANHFATMIRVLATPASDGTVVIFGCVV